MTPRSLAFVLAFLGGVLFDQGTKAWARATDAMQGHEGWAIQDKLLHFVHRENPGAAFSLLAGLPDPWRTLTFLAFNVVACVIGFQVLRAATPDERWKGAFVGTFLAGAIGNAIDRVAKGTVTDFIRVHVDYEPVYSTLVSWFGRADWPVFNIADALLFIGVGGLVILDRKKAEPAPAAESAGDPDRAASP